MSQPLIAISKKYPQRGPLQQFRFEKSISFGCFRCGSIKIAKLIAIYEGDWEKKLCNACYGRLLSIFEIKIGNGTNDEKADVLSDLLLELIDADTIRKQTQRILLRQNQASFLLPTSLRFFATSECVADTLSREANLDWSPAVIGLCKAFELELADKFTNQLRNYAQNQSFNSTDLKDIDFGRIVSYCAGKTEKSPESGVVSRFLSTARNSKTRLETSDFLKETWKPFLSTLPFSGWLVKETGLSNSIDILTKNYRNKAAHTDELSFIDYQSCKELVFGDNGIMWELIISVNTK